MIAHWNAKVPKQNVPNFNGSNNQGNNNEGYNVSYNGYLTIFVENH